MIISTDFNMENLQPIHEYTDSEGYLVMKTILNKIYIARNITLNESAIIEQLKNIDRLMKTVDDH